MTSGRGFFVVAEERECKNANTCCTGVLPNAGCQQTIEFKHDFLQKGRAAVHHQLPTVRLRLRELTEFRQPLCGGLQLLTLTPFYQEGTQAACGILQGTSTYNA